MLKFVALAVTALTATTAIARDLPTEGRSVEIMVRASELNTDAGYRKVMKRVFGAVEEACGSFGTEPLFVESEAAACRTSAFRDAEKQLAAIRDQGSALTDRRADVRIAARQ